MVQKDYNHRHAACDLPLLQPGDRMWVQSEQCPATDLSPGQHHRCYIVEAQRGLILQLNHNGLVLFSSPEEQPTKEQVALLNNIHN